MSRRVIAISAIGTIALMATIWEGKAQQTAPPDFSGGWELVSASGTTPPEGFSLQMNQTSTALQVQSSWTPAASGQYGLTLIGLLTPELTFTVDGREDLNQAGPFVIHSKTRWSGARLITAWNTSEYQGTSFEGQWVRSSSADGREFTLEVHANSSQGQHSDAVLKFRKK
ncbi:MAG TPA: hypothetical protein VGH38_06360 [Bryobacteraceae bacterium]|jgi:hypothetical protein